jgi:hypothetical protein
MTYLELIQYIRQRMATEHLATLAQRTGIPYGQLHHFSEKGGNFRDPESLVKAARHYGYKIVAESTR